MAKKSKPPKVPANIQARVDKFFTLPREQQRKVLVTIFTGYRNLQDMLTDLPEDE